MASAASSSIRRCSISYPIGARKPSGLNWNAPLFAIRIWTAKLPPIGSLWMKEHGNDSTHKSWKKPLPEAR